jgi:hypothetical protein
MQTVVIIFDWLACISNNNHNKARQLHGIYHLVVGGEINNNGVYRWQ